MAPARRATANVDAPVWKSYVAARVEPGAGAFAKATTLTRTRKRVKPTFTDSNVLPVHSSGFTTKHHSTTRASVRAYWESLSVTERLQILLVDDPDIVKQLYKLNLSLLCVGLMQRHLKTGATRTVTTSTPSAATSTNSNNAGPSTSVTKAATAPSEAPPASASDSERTYDLLEAMEFMDIGTGILTVKTELVEDVDHMFALVIAVLHGFLMTVHVLSEAQFRDLFVTESEVINTWEDYERLIAMLVEQLMLRSYVAHLEKQATQQMEALLLEASLEEEKKTQPAVGTLSVVKKKKKKNKRKTEGAKMMQSTPLPIEATEIHDEDDNVVSDSESEPDKEEGNAMAVDEFTCHSECSTDDADLSGPSSPVKSVAKALNQLNPHARAFEPSLLVEPSMDEELRSPTFGKRKLDDFIIHIPWQDIADAVEAEEEEEKDMIAAELGCHRPQEKYRRRDDDAELEWHLQHMYASASSLLGWDFTKQREITAVPSAPWIDASLWRTDPRDVVRYYFPPTDQPRDTFAPAGLLAAPSTGPPSRYYYSLPDHTSHNAGRPSSPRSGDLTTPMFPPLMATSSGPPVSFWDEHATSTPVYPPVFEPQPYPEFHPTNAQARRQRPAHAPEQS